jgi:hypothetical protein
MSRHFKLISGSDEVDLINTADPGIIASRGGFGRNRNVKKNTFTSSELADGASLRFQKALPVAERYRLNLKGSSHDNAASQIQSLQRIMRKGDLNQLTDWQEEPLYIKQQTTNETNTRYSKVLAWQDNMYSDFFAPPFESDNQLDDFELSLVREPFWRSTVPGTVPSAETMKFPDFPWFDEYGGTRANFDVTAAAALEGDWGGAFTLDGAGSEINGVDNLPNAETTIALEILIDPNSLTMTDTDTFLLIDAASPGTGSSAFIVELVKDGSAYELVVTARDDAGGDVALADVPIVDGLNLVRIEWVAASGPGGNDGTIEIFLGGVSQETDTTVDSDTHNITSIKVGAISGLDAGTSGTFYIDRYRWDDALAPSAYERTIDFEQTLGFFSNFRQSTGVLSHIYAFDDSATGFSANLAFEPSWPWFEVSGSTPAVGDVMYFGSAEPFFNLIFNKVVDLDADGLTFDVEYWNGGWTDIPDFGYQFIGARVLKWAGKGDWATTAVNGQTKFWVRIIIDGLTSWTTSAQQGEQIVYTVNNPYIELNNVQVHGDVPPISLFRLLNYIGVSVANVAWVGMGIKSRGADNFISRLNAGGDNPASWAEDYGTDTAKTADESAPEGNNATCTFATNQALTQRLNIRVADADIETDFEGTYRIYLRAKQVGGDSGDVIMQMQVVRSLTLVGEEVKMLQADADIDLYDMGIFNIASEDVLGDETKGALNLQFKVFASSSGGTTPNLEMHDIVLMPVDEQSLFLSWPGQEALSTKRGLQIDSGVLRENTYRIRFVDTVAGGRTFTVRGPWETRGSFLEIEPRRKSRIYFLIAAENSNIIDRANQAQGMGINLHLVEQWNTLRGSD